MAAARLKTATPAQSPAAGSMMMPSRSHDFFTQSSVRPIMMVQVGAIQEVSWPAASRFARARSMASPTASACATVKDTVALMVMPSSVTRSMASIPAATAGNLIWTFGASVWKWRACSTILSTERLKVGLIWIERRPFWPCADW